MEQNFSIMCSVSKTDPQRQAQYPQSAGDNFEKKSFSKILQVKINKKSRIFKNFVLSDITKQAALCQSIAYNDHKRQ